MKIRAFVRSLAVALPFFPAIALAQTTGIALYITRVGLFINKFIIPTLLALAFLFFIWNVFRFFILGGANSEDQTKAKSLAIWGIAAFVFIVSIWGLTNVIVTAFGIQGNNPVCPDYYTNCNG